MERTVSDRENVRRVVCSALVPIPRRNLENPRFRRCGFDKPLESVIRKSDLKFAASRKLGAGPQLALALCEHQSAGNTEHWLVSTENSGNGWNYRALQQIGRKTEKEKSGETENESNDHR